MSTEPRSRAWVEANPSALRRNLRRIRVSVGPGVRVLPLLKANAYGTGLLEAARVLEGEDPWGFGVATVSEGLALRSAGVARPILVVAPVSRDAVEDALTGGLTLAVSDLDTLAAVERWAGAGRSGGRTPAVHLEVDTGMGRSGFDWRAVEDWLPRVLSLTGIRVRLEGVFTHFHSAERSGGAVTEQADRFRGVVGRMKEGARRGAATAGGPGWILHMANSAASLGRPDTAEGMVRPGIFLYGGVAGVELPRPEEVVSLRARVVLVRDVPPGTSLGYGETYRSSRRERWATVGIGYGDGLPRALGNRGHAVVGGRRVPIVGRISMDLTVVDITDLGDPGPPVGSVATFIGSDGSERISLEEVADLAGRINYEILTGLAARLPRVWDDLQKGSA